MNHGTELTLCLEPQCHCIETESSETVVDAAMSLVQNDAACGSVDISTQMKFGIDGWCEAMVLTLILMERCGILHANMTVWWNELS